MRYVFVEPHRAEALKRELIERKALENGPVLTENGRVGFPVTEHAAYETVERTIDVPESHTSLRDALRDRIGPRADAIKRAFDVIGDIAIIERTRGSENIETDIAHALLETHKNIKTVLIKDGGHEGDYRIQRYRWLAGDNRTTTIHKENGYALELDVATSYFSPRVGGERMRIATMIGEERVLVIGSGIGPYPICIEKHSRAREIIGVEFNTNAHEYALKNTKRNACERIECVRADAREYLSENHGYDRIIMPLPAQSSELAPLAYDALNPEGVMHVYTFIHEGEEPKGFPGRIEHVETVGAAAPGYYRVCLDIRANAVKRR